MSMIPLRRTRPEHSFGLKPMSLTRGEPFRAGARRLWKWRPWGWQCSPEESREARRSDEELSGSIRAHPVPPGLDPVSRRDDLGASGDHRMVGENLLQGIVAKRNAGGFAFRDRQGDAVFRRNYQVCAAARTQLEVAEVRFGHDTSTRNCEFSLQVRDEFLTNFLLGRRRNEHEPTGV